MAQSVALRDVGRVGRSLRNPAHSWQVRQKPFLLQPICFAPVLPGETLKNLLFQARVVTEPIKNPLIGWWCEYYWFYVKHRDLAGASDFMGMMVNPGQSMSGQVTAAASVPLYRTTNQINWQQQCLDAIVDAYFRGEGEAPADIDGLPVVGINHNGWWDSAKTLSAYTVGDINVDLNANSTITASEVQRALMQWEFLRANNLTEMTYEDYLRSYGVRVQEEVTNVPELIRYTREWSYPTNTINPTDGTPTSAVSWAVSERADKDRFFKEPGFIVGLSVVRPKVYLSEQRCAAINLLSDAYAWLPAIMREDPATSIRQIAAGAGSIWPDQSTAFWVDIRDLFLYGDQFVNFSLSATDAGFVALPSADTTNLRYPSNADILGLFVGTTPTALVKQDGIAKFSILGAQTETSPRGSRTGVVL